MAHLEHGGVRLGGLAPDAAAASVSEPRRAGVLGPAASIRALDAATHSHGHGRRRPRRLHRRGPPHGGGPRRLDRAGLRRALLRPETARASGRDLSPRPGPLLRILARDDRSRGAAGRRRAHGLRRHRHPQPPPSSGRDGRARARLRRRLRQADDARPAAGARDPRSGRVERTTLLPHPQLHRLPDGEGGAQLVASGRLGEIRKVVVEYPQGWLAERLEATGQKQASWRTDPARAGAAGCMGDIGTHCHQLAEYVTGLEVDALCADLTTFVRGRALDDDGNVLLRFAGRRARACSTPARSRWARRTACACASTASAAGSTGARRSPTLWSCAGPTARPRSQRTGGPTVSAAAKRATRLPMGHPEGFIEAFANLYRDFALALDARRRGEPIDRTRPRLPHRARRRARHAVPRRGGRERAYRPAGSRSRAMRRQVAAAVPRARAARAMSRAPQRHALHRPVGRPAARDPRREGRGLRLRRARAGVLGRPLRRRPRARRRRLLPRAARPPRAPRARRVGDLEPPRGPGGVRSHRRAPPRDPAARASGATAIPRACAGAPPRR